MYGQCKQLPPSSFQIILQSLEGYFHSSNALLIFSILLQRWVLGDNNLYFLSFLNQIFFFIFLQKTKEDNHNCNHWQYNCWWRYSFNEEAEYDAQVEQDDEGQIAHDESSVLSIHDQAIEVMRAQRVRMTREEEQVALNLSPKVSPNICIIF